MNEIWHTAMHPVVVTGMTKGQAICHFVTKFRAFPNFHYMVCFKATVGATVLALVAITFQHGILPDQIFGAATALCLAVVLALGHALTGSTTVDVGQGPLARCANKGLAANFAGVSPFRSAARTGTEHFSADLGRGSNNRLAAGLARVFLLLDLPCTTTGTGTEPLLVVDSPAFGGQLGDLFPASFTGL